MEDFKSRTSLEERKLQSIAIMKKYPDRVPVYVYKHKQSKMNDINKHKFLVPLDITVGQFMYIIRKHLSLKKEEAIFVFINGFLPPNSSLISQLYNEHHDDDGFLYIAFSYENTFG